MRWRKISIFFFFLISFGILQLVDKNREKIQWIFLTRKIMDKNEAERFRKISIPIRIFLHARKYQTKV